MRTWPLGVAAVVCIGLAGCRYFRSTKVSLTPGGQSSEREREPYSRPPALPRTKSLYQGWSAEQWGETIVNDPDPDAARRAGRALSIMGAEGRPYLVGGLESPLPENRRIALEALTVSDLRVFGDRGRKLLLKLAGDPSDLRIRERAQVYLVQWDRAAPSP